MTNQLLEQLAAGNMKFSDVLAYIESMYQHIPTGFRNGNHYNAATDNQGSARVLFFAKLHNLNKEQTLSLFAEHYQQVLETPDAENHQNIRSFMQQGWEGVHFEGEALLPDKQEP
ncbi:MAG: HopJ type III effector protein [Chitinophagaceae bacterium]|nr:HopJ type III effector protein [Chitinophagaceae bacterium]MCW5926403.1 HopJ type III effector protein [Chitinophagaceae bacterium]